jgi:uncharacterized protein (DUF2235 family)
MIHKVGLLPTCNHQQVPFAYKMYTKADDEGWKQLNAFKKAFSNEVDIEFLGVWQVVLHKPFRTKTAVLTFLVFYRDTVNLVGLIPRRLPFTTSNKVVKTFRHAVALDERRAKFKANLWNRPHPTEQILSVTDQKLQKAAENPKSKKSPTHVGTNPSGLWRKSMVTITITTQLLTSTRLVISRSWCYVDKSLNPVLYLI